MASRRVILTLCASAFSLSLFACWIIPWRMRYGPGGSWYSFAYVGDEDHYADRLAPLINGSTAANVANGIGDPQVIAPFFLENFIRLIVSATGLDVVTVYWIWRAVFPPAFAACLVLLAFKCVARRRPWSLPLCLASAAVIFPFIYCVYDLVTQFPPLQGFINRIPTNIEYPLSAILAYAWLSFLRAPSLRAGIVLSAVSVASVYLRPYLVIPWSLAITSGMIFLIIHKKLSARILVPIGIVLLLGILPLIAIAKWNGHSQAYTELLARYFPPPTYEIHKNWSLFTGIALVLAASTWRVESWAKPFVAGSAFAMASVVFLSGAFSFGSELTTFDRYGSFYLIVIAAAGMLLLARKIQAWTGLKGERQARKASFLLLTSSAICSAVLIFTNSRQDFSAYPEGPYAALAADAQYIPAYRWVREHTDAGALFVVDDGTDWSRVGIDGKRPIVNAEIENDLFLLVARRRRVMHPRLNCYVISNDDYKMLLMVHLGTLGYPTERNAYALALKTFPPQYIFWRRTVPFPRGQIGNVLRNMSTVVYTDTVCEVWKLNYEQ